VKALAEARQHYSEIIERSGKIDIINHLKSQKDAATGFAE
jgi:hypothetical protein